MQPSQTFITPDRITISGMTTNYWSPFHKSGKESLGLLRIIYTIVCNEIKHTYPTDVHPHLRHFTILTSAHVTQKNRIELTFSAEFLLYKRAQWIQRAKRRESKGKWEKESESGLSCAGNTPMWYSDWLRRILWDTAAAREDPPLLRIRSVCCLATWRSHSQLQAKEMRSMRRGAKQGTVGNEQTSSLTNAGCQRTVFRLTQQALSQNTSWREIGADRKTTKP